MEQKGRDIRIYIIYPHVFCRTCSILLVHCPILPLHRFELREAVRQLLTARASLGREGTQGALLLSCAAESGPQFVEVAEVCFV